jgi:hypothetical protein
VNKTLLSLRSKVLKRAFQAEENVVRIWGGKTFRPLIKRRKKSYAGSENYSPYISRKKEPLETSSCKTCSPQTTLMRAWEVILGIIHTCLFRNNEHQTRENWGARRLIYAGVSRVFKGVS